MNNVQFIEGLVDRFPALQDLYDAHLFNQGELLPHVFFLGVTREVVSAFLDQNTDDVDWRAVLAFLDESLSTADPEVTAVIATSFLDFLPHPDKPGHDIVHHLGPTLTRRFQAMRPRG